jgi:hypothetical protein
VGFVRLDSARVAAIVGMLLLAIGSGWLAMADYERRAAPDWIRYEWTAPWVLRVMVSLGLVSLIWAVGVTLYKFLCRGFRR